MTLVLKNQEKIEKEIQIDTPHGKGIMYVTTNVIVLEQKSKGIFFERLHSQIASIEATDKKHIKISWPEGRQMFDYTFKIKEARENVKEIVERHNYEDNFPDLMGVNSVVLSEKEQKEIIKERTKRAEKMIEATKKELDEANLKLNMIASNDPDKANKILEAAKITKPCQDNFEMWSKYLQDIPNIIMNRSKKIPKEVSNHLCWNDCWYDENSKCFITFNNYWKFDLFQKQEGPKKFYENNTIPNTYAIPFDYVQFVDGYPSHMIMYDEDEPRLALIPTITDDMLTENMIAKAYGYEDVQAIGKIIPKKINATITYKVSEGSKLILKNGEKYDFTRKETIYFLDRNLVKKEIIPLLP